MKEEWVDACIYGYKVSDKGNAKRVEHKIEDGKGFLRTLKEKDCVQSKHNGGYISFCMAGKKHLAHRIIFESFFGEIPKDKQINHINGDKKDNRIDNLELVTPKENIDHAISLGIFINKNRKPSKGVSHTKTKLKEEDVVHLRRMYWETDFSPKEISDIFQISKGCVFDIAKFRTWKHINHPYPTNRVFNNRWGSKIVK